MVNKVDRILRWRDVNERVGLSRTTVYRLIRAEKFPPSQLIGEAAIGWRESVIETWIAGKWAVEQNEKAA